MAHERKPRILYVAKILFEETDPEHGLTLPQIQERLEGYGISSERKALYRDLAGLRQIGLDVQKTPTRPVGYCLATRLFTPAQMALLLDAVRTSRSLTAESSAELMERLHRLQSAHDPLRAGGRVLVTGRSKTRNAAVLNTVTLIQRALAERRDISFQYQRYDASLKLTKATAHDGAERVKTPLFLVYQDDNYYLLVFDEDAPDHLRSYRVDRMANVMLRETSDPAHKPDAAFDVARFERERVGMYNVEPVRLTLEVAEGLMDGIVDLFDVDGMEATPSAVRPGWANVHVTASPSPVLFGKLAQFGGRVRVKGPARVAEAYRAHLQACLDAQE